MSQTHYEVLGVTPEATYDEIKGAFHHLARTCHPDKSNCVTVERFRRIQQAWETLRDETQRNLYNDHLQHEALKEKAKRGGVLTVSWKELEEAQDEDTGETILVYDCRCGEEIVVDQSTEGEACMVECPGCCFVYRFPKRIS